MQILIRKLGLPAFIALLMILPNTADAQLLEIIQAATKKVIRQIDLKVQKMQNKTIWLQNAQKVLENKMAELKLKEISNWTQKQRDLFKGYYEELSKVKAAIVTYSKVKQVISQQVQIAGEYKETYNLIKENKQFTVSEKAYIYKIYTGMIDESLKHLDELYMVVNPGTMQMTDAKRMELVEAVSVKMQRCLDDLRKFNNHNKQLSQQREKLGNENKTLKRIHGLK